MNTTNFHSTTSKLFKSPDAKSIGSRSKGFQELKEMNVTHNLLYNYESLYKSDVRGNKIYGYLDKARETYNDWEANYKES